MLGLLPVVSLLKPLDLVCKVMAPLAVMAVGKELVGAAEKHRPERVLE